MSAGLARRRRRHALWKGRGGCRKECSSAHRRRLKIELLEDRRLLAVNPLPLPLQAEPPLGGLIYDSPVSADIGASGETDDFTIDLDDGQTVTVVVDPDTTLQPTIQLSDPGSTVIGTATAAAAGQQVVLQTIATTGAGTYTVTVGGAGTAGAYTTQVILNAAVELEEHDGPNNDDMATAQELTGSFVPLGGGLGQRAAVLGSLQTTVLTVYSANMDTDPRWALEGDWEFGVPTGGGSGGGDPTSGFTGSNVIGYNLYGDYSDDMPIRYATTPPIDASMHTGCTLSFYRWLGVEDSEYDHASVQVSNDGSNWTTLWEHIGASLNDASWLQQRFDISAVADGQPTVFIRWAMGPTDYTVTYPGWNVDDVLLTSEETIGDDYYRMDMAAGESATAAVTSLGGGSVDLELLDASGTAVATGVWARNVYSSVDNFVAPADGTYFVKVSGKGDYSLLATRNTGFDNQANKNPGAAQELSGTGLMLGHLAGTPPAGLNTGGSDDDAGTGGAQGTSGDGTAPPGNDKYAPGELIVRFAEPANGLDKTDLLAARGAIMLGELPLINGAVVRLLNVKTDVREAAARWSADPAFLYAEPNYQLHTWDTFPNDPSFVNLWGLHNTGQSGGVADADVDAPEAWSVSTGSGSVVVANIDTGVDYNHEDLGANMWVNPGETPGDGIDNDGNGYVDDVYGIDAVNGDSDPFDNNGHGTHTAGTIGAVGNNGLGVAGLNWDVQIMALKFLDASGFGSTDGAIACLDYVTMMRTNYGINVVASNNSWGGGGFSQALRDAIEASNQAGILFVAAAGNGGWDGVGDDNDLIPHYPSNYELDGIIAVAATDHNDRRASFSNYGATSVDL
ncbi:MAG: S8 family serine peptidase, partial [Planctomycetota bacterium]